MALDYHGIIVLDKTAEASDKFPVTPTIPVNEGTKPGTKVQVLDSLHGIFIGIYNGQAYARTSDGHRCDFLAQDSALHTAAKSLGFDPAGQHYYVASIDRVLIEETTSAEETVMADKRFANKDTPAGTKVNTLHGDGIFLGLCKGSLWVKHKDCIYLDDDIKPLAKSLGLDPEAREYGAYGLCNTTIEILEEPPATKAVTETTTSTESTPMSGSGKRYLSSDTKIGSHLIIGDRPAIFLGCITGFTSHGQVFFTDDKDDGCHIVGDIFAKHISDVGLDPKAKKVRDIVLKGNTVEVVEDTKPASKASTYLMIGGALLGGAIAAFCKATEAPAARVEVEEEVSDEDILSSLEINKEAVA